MGVFLHSFNADRQEVHQHGRYSTPVDRRRRCPSVQYHSLSSSVTSVASATFGIIGRKIGSELTMVSLPNSNRLLDYVQRRAGDYFRGCATYSADGAELLTKRDGLDERTMNDRVEEMYRAIRLQDRFDAVDTLGPPSAIIQLRQKAVLVHFPVDDEYGYLLGMEPEAARDLHSFVSECHTIIHDED